MAIAPRESDLPDTLKTFIAHFEASNNSHSSFRLTVPPAELPPTVSTVSEVRTLQCIYGKQEAPANLPVPACNSTSNTIPVPKITTAKIINDFDHNDHKMLAPSTRYVSAKYTGSHIVKFADDTVVRGLKSLNFESPCRQEVEDLIGRTICIFSIVEKKRSW